MKPIQLVQNDTPIIRKTKELCQTILEQEAYQALKKDIQDFLAEPALREHYHRLCDLQDQLHHKHEHGESISDEELETFERDEAALLGNPLAQAFVEAQRKMHKIEETVTAYVRKTFELGRLPAESDFEEEGGGCGPGCGCH